MTIKARFKPKNVSIEILDVFDSPECKLAEVKACEGSPFAGGDKWPMATCFATVKASDLAPTPSGALSEREPANLLSLVLAAARGQWPNSDTVWPSGRRQPATETERKDMLIPASELDTDNRVKCLHPGWPATQT